MRFDVLQQKARPNHFTLVAVWESADAFAGHEASAETRRFREALGPMLGALYDERLYRPISL
jgi:quinol monooxygenase YgiN